MVSDSFFVFWDVYHPQHIGNQLFLISCGRSFEYMSFENAELSAEEMQNKAAPGFIYYFGTDEDFYADMPQLVPI